MFRTRERAYVYPNRYVIVDILSRTGPAKDDDFSPFEGRRNIIDDQLTGPIRDNFTFDKFLQHDVELSPRKVKEEIHNGTLVTKGRAGVYTTLEDLFYEDSDGNKKELQAVKRFVENMLIGVKINNSSKVNNIEDFTRSIESIGDDGEFTEEKYLMVSDSEISDVDDVEAARSKMAYVVKVLWNYSKMYQGNLIGFTNAYWSILNRNEGVCTTHKFRDYSCQRIDEHGNLKYMMVNGSSTAFFDHSTHNNLDSYRGIMALFCRPSGRDYKVLEFVNEYIRLGTILGINPEEQDQTKFTNELVNRIVCTYIPTNDEYLQSYGDLDADIRMLTKPENILSKLKGSVYTIGTTEEDVDIVDYIQNINDTLVYEYNRLRSNTNDKNKFLLEDMTTYIEYIIRRFYPEVLRYSTDDVLGKEEKVRWTNGGLACRSDGTVITLPGHKFFDLYINNKTITYDLVFQRAGLFIPVLDIQEILYMTMNDFVEVWKDKQYHEEKINWKHLSDNT